MHYLILMLTKTHKPCKLVPNRGHKLNSRCSGTKGYEDDDFLVELQSWL